MADFLSIDVQGLTQLQDQLARAVDRLDAPADLMDTLGAILESQIGGRFASKTDPSGAAWLPLADSTRARYDAQDTNGRGQLRSRGSLLERSRDMLNSLTRNTTANSVEVGMSRLSDDRRWAIPLLHETGTRNMPRRGIFLADWEAGTLGPADERLLMDEISTWLDDLLS